MLFRCQIARFVSFSKCLTIRRYSLSSFKRSKEFNDRHLESFIESKDFSSMGSAMLHIRATGHRVFIVQPSMKFKARGRQSTTGQLQLTESISLVESLEKWSVVGHGIYTLKSSGSKRFLYGRGNVEKLTEEIRNSRATAVFISIDRLSLIQIESLAEKFSVPVYDRYSIVLQVKTNRSSTIFLYRIDFSSRRFLKITLEVALRNSKLRWQKFRCCATEKMTSSSSKWKREEKPNFSDVLSRKFRCFLFLLRGSRTKTEIGIRKTRRTSKINKEPPEIDRFADGRCSWIHKRGKNIVN